MDYVEWCGWVLDRVVDAQIRDRTLRWTGFTEQQIGEMVFVPEFAELVAGSGDSSERALYQAVRELYVLGSLRDGGPLEAPLSRFWLTDQGTEGSEGLRSRWFFMCGEDLEPERAQLLNIVNHLSEKCYPQFATVEPVKYERVINELGWESEHEMARFHALEMSQGGSGLLGYGGNSDRQLIFVANYKGLVYTSRERPKNPFAELEELLSSPRIAPTTDLGFEFVSDDSTREVLTKDAAEAAACFRVGAWKGSAILSAGVVEGCLLNATQRSEVRLRPEFEEWLRNNPRYRDRQSGDPIWKQMGLGVLIEIAQTTNLIGGPGAKILSAAKDYRDTVHVSAEVREDVRAGKPDAELLISITRFVHDQLSEALSKG